MVIFLQQKLGTKLVGVVAMDQGLGIVKRRGSKVEGHKIMDDKSDTPG